MLLFIRMKTYGELGQDEPAQRDWEALSKMTPWIESQVPDWVERQHDDPVPESNRLGGMTKHENALNAAH